MHDIRVLIKSDEVLQCTQYNLRKITFTSYGAKTSNIHTGALQLQNNEKYKYNSISIYLPNQYFLLKFKAFAFTIYCKFVGPKECKQVKVNNLNMIKLIQTKENEK